jgi:predicted transcriptional regulator
MRVVSLKLPAALDRTLSEIARRRNASRSAVLRQALESFARAPNRSVTALAEELVGSLAGPTDLSTSAKHLSGYGK